MSPTYARPRPPPPPNSPSLIRVRNARGWTRYARIWGQRWHATRTTRRSKLTALTERLNHVRPDTGTERLRLDGLTHRADTVLLTRLAAARTTLAGIRGRVATLDPTATLARGYAIVEDARGHTVTSSRTLRAGQRVDLRFHDGVTTADITDPPAR